MGMQFLPGSLELDNNPYDLELWAKLVHLIQGFNGYCAYKIPFLGASSVSEVPSFIIVTQEHGVLLVDIVHDKLLSVEEDGRTWKTNSGISQSRDVILELYVDEIEARFKRSANLYDRRNKKSLVPINSLLIFRENSLNEINTLDIKDYSFSDMEVNDSFNTYFEIYISKNKWNGENKQFDDILSLIEGTWDYRGSPIIIDKSQQTNTVNGLIQKSLNRTFKQDNAQRQVSMQIPNGPQRIRGLAGTGKTVVLSLKAALTALRAPDFKILYLFNTQSLYNLIERQIGDYYSKESKSSLPQGSIDILHAWGGRTSGKGLYSKICEDYSISPLTLRDVPRNVDGLSVIYKQLDTVLGESLNPIYDMVLIDEAQDFPNEVFNIVYKLTKNPKRIIVAYDDFQSLKSLRIREFEELFGNNSDGSPRFTAGTLSGTYAGDINKDFVLSNCYRNPRIVLMVAHGIALGIKRPGGVVDSVDRVGDWKALGYQVNSPLNKDIIEEGDSVEVERLDKNSTNLLENLIQESGKPTDNLIQVDGFENQELEISHIAEKIKFLVETQEVKPHAIYVIAINTKTCEVFLKAIRSKLNEFGIRSIMPGFVESSRHFFEKDCVVLTTPFKAKGNESDVVFVANCETVTADSTFRKRNAFFVSLTRSRGWCYITGVGENMDRLKKEITAIKSDIPKFIYERPSDDLIARRRFILAKTDNSIETDQALLEKIARNNPDLLKEFSQQLLFQEPNSDIEDQE
jgi:superfamily I DNA and RNA helicase